MRITKTPASATPPTIGNATHHTGSFVAGAVGAGVGLLSGFAVAVGARAGLLSGFAVATGAGVGLLFGFAAAAGAGVGLRRRHSLRRRGRHPSGGKLAFAAHGIK